MITYRDGSTRSSHSSNPGLYTSRNPDLLARNPFKM